MGNATTARTAVEVPSTDEPDPIEALWTRLHRPIVDDFANGVRQLDRLAVALSTAVRCGYVENAEAIPTAAIALDDAQMVARLVEHACAEHRRVADDLDHLRTTVTELLRLAEAVEQ